MDRCSTIVSRLILTFLLFSFDAVSHLQAQDATRDKLVVETLIRLKRFDEGVLFLQILADSHPEKPGYWKMLGDAGRQKGDRALAIQAYTTAIERGHKDEMLPAIVQKLMKASDSEKSP